MKGHDKDEERVDSAAIDGGSSILSAMMMNTLPYNYTFASDHLIGLGRQDATTVRNQQHNYGDVAHKDTKLED